MRTTLKIDDDILEIAQIVAREEGVSVGHAITRMARQGLRSKGVGIENDSSGLPVFEVPAEAQVVTSETVARALED